MTIRTFKQLGQGYAAEPLTITASIDEVVVYSGEIPTLDQPADPTTLFNPFGQQLFTWQLDTEFAGSVAMNFTIVGAGVLFLSDTFANYVQIPNPNPAPGSPAYINSGPDVFGSFYQEVTPEYILGDPFTNVKINGVDQITPGRTELTSGQWRWAIEVDGTFSATVNIFPNALSPATPDY